MASSTSSKGGAGELTSGEIGEIYGAARSSAGASELDEGTRAYLERVLGRGVALLAHQERALAWMLERERAGQGGILADEPGLGKTLTSLCLIACDWRGRRKGTLVVTPTTAIREQWASEAHRFLGSSGSVVRYEGVGKPYARSSADAAIASLRTCRIALCDLATLRREHHLREAEVGGRTKDVVAPLFAVGWSRVVVDEVQDVEARASISASAAKALPCERRWGISGTPIARGSLEAMRGLYELAGALPYCDASFWSAQIARPLSSGDAGARAAALEVARAAAAEHMWRTHKREVGAGALEVKAQRRAPVVVVEPGAAEVAATRPALEHLLQSAVRTARAAGFEGDARELSSRDARALLSAGSSSSKAKSSGGSFAALCRAATAVSLLDNTGARKPRASSSKRARKEEDDEEEVASWVCCDACEKWRRVPRTATVDKARPWRCADARNWGVTDASCAVPQEEEDASGPEEEEEEEGGNSNGAARDRPSLDGALARCSNRCAARVGATAATLATVLVNKARQTGLVRPCAEVIALLLAALCVARHGCPPDELEARGREGEAPVEATAAVRATLPPSVAAMTLEKLETEARRLKVFADVAARGDDGGQRAEERAALLAAARSALFAERAGRRLATAMASHARLGARSPARVVPQQVWQDHVWLFVDGGAGDFVAELVDRGRDACGGGGARRARLAVLDIDERLRLVAGARDSPPDFDDDDDPLLDASFRQRRADHVDSLRRAREEEEEEDDSAELASRQRRLDLDRAARAADDRRIDLMRRVMIGGGGLGGGGEMATADGLEATRAVARRLGTALLDPSSSSRGPGQRVRDVVEWIADPRRHNTVGAHEEQLVAKCRQWVYASQRQRGGGGDDASAAAAAPEGTIEALARAISREADWLASQCVSARVRALAAARRVGVDLALGGYDPIDADLALRREPSSASGRRAVAPAPARLEQHAACGACASGAWRTFESRRAMSNWGRSLCALCAARKRVRVFRAYVCSARSDGDSALVRLVRALAGKPNSAAATQIDRAAVEELDRCRDDADAAFAVVRDADATATMAACFRRAAFVPAATHYGASTLLWSSYPRAVNHASIDSIARLVFPRASSSKRSRDDGSNYAKATPSEAWSSWVANHNPTARRRRGAIPPFPSSSAEINKIDCSSFENHLGAVATTGALLARVGDERFSLVARVALASCVLDDEASSTRVSFDDATRSAAFARAVEVARADQRRGRAACAACAAIADDDLRVARNCAHVLCSACATDRTDCPACGVLHGQPMARQPLVDARSAASKRAACDYGAKIDSVCDLVQGIAARNEKCLVFSSWADALDLVATALDHRRVKSLALRGTPAQAPEVLRDFRTARDCTALLLSLRTSNAGLNISEASSVILLDTTLDTSLETQAVARVQRLDSRHATTVYRFITASSIEAAIWQLRSSSDNKVTRAQVFDLLVDQHRRALK
ncbi:hypothetical protein CTAYLR_003874 [Chrysophaeum taylorii]|uniref:Uncharacterized protein n=1 Tax=Chrysophaeum taylorii TaxID=2483200 RepID=A0AAD7XNW8_9STRA|nr:hypothetical protein CTAYLR_003874 [Chrysophaeum taylorii]